MNDYQKISNESLQGFKTDLVYLARLVCPVTIMKQFAIQIFLNGLWKWSREFCLDLENFEESPIDEAAVRLIIKEVVFQK